MQTSLSLSAPGALPGFERRAHMPRRALAIILLFWLPGAAQSPGPPMQMPDGMNPRNADLNANSATMSPATRMQKMDEIEKLARNVKEKMTYAVGHAPDAGPYTVWQR